MKRGLSCGREGWWTNPVPELLDTYCMVCSHIHVYPTLCSEANLWCDRRRHRSACRPARWLNFNDWTMAAAYIPQELIDAISDLLHDDKDALAACRLVCRAWSMSLPARDHLFRQVCLDVPRMRTLSQFGAPLTPFIRFLHLKDPVDFDGWNEALPLLGLHHIRSLAVTYMPWHEIASNAQSAFLRQFADITSLRLSRLEFSSFSELVRILGSFVRLETLVLNSISYSGASVWNLPPPPRHSLCNLSRLELRSCQVDDVLAWLVSFQPMPPLHTVYLHGIRSDACRVLGKFLRALGPSLETLFYEPHAYHGMSSPLLWSDSACSSP